MGPNPSHTLSASSSNFVYKRPNFGFKQTDRQTDGAYIFDIIGAYNL